MDLGDGRVGAFVVDEAAVLDTVYAIFERRKVRFLLDEIIDCSRVRARRRGRVASRQTTSTGQQETAGRDVQRSLLLLAVLPPTHVHALAQGAILAEGWGIVFRVLPVTAMRSL